VELGTGKLPITSINLLGLYFGLGDLFFNGDSETGSIISRSVGWSSGEYCGFPRACDTCGVLRRLRDFRFSQSNC